MLFKMAEKRADKVSKPALFRKENGIAVMYLSSFAFQPELYASF